MEFEELNLDTLKYLLVKGKLDSTKPITMRHLQDAGVFKTTKHGVKLLARVRLCGGVTLSEGRTDFQHPCAA